MTTPYYALTPWQREELQERVDAERAGPCRRLLNIRIDSRPTGRVWGHNPARPGPLDGQPECKHYAVALYSDGTTQEWGPMARTGG